MVAEAVGLAEQRGAALLSIVGAPSALTALGFEQNAFMWYRPAPAGTRPV